MSALTAGDYLLWNWALSGGHDVLALVSGLTLPPLAAACALMLALGLARVLARSSQRSATLAGSFASSIATSRRNRRYAGRNRRIAGRRRVAALRVSPVLSRRPADPTRGEARTRILGDAERPSSSPDGVPAADGVPARASRKLAA